MYRQSSSRNQRSKRIKVRHALQICLLLAVCFWLIYQVKHSHDKKKEFDESDSKDSIHRGSSIAFVQLGRKDIHPRVETLTKNEKHDEAEEEEETTEEEVEENKPEEEMLEDKKVEEEDDEGMRDGDDETDEHEIEKLDTEVDQEEDFVEDEKEREHGVDNETEGKNSDDGNDQMEKEISVKDADHDGDDRITHEAHEELYKADDASSAVTHDTHIETTENEYKRAEKSNGHSENILEQENKENNREETNNGEMWEQLEVEGGEMAKDDNPSIVIDGETNITTSETKENTLDNLENGSSPNNKLTKVFNDNLETSNSSTEVTTQNPELSLQNVTESVSELDHGEGIVTEGTSTEGSNWQTIALEQTNSSTLDVENNPLDSNSTGHTESKDAESNFEKFSNPSNNTDSSSLVKITRSEAPVEAVITTKSATEKNNTTEAENSDTSDGTSEVLASEISKNPQDSD